MVPPTEIYVLPKKIEVQQRRISLSEAEFLKLQLWNLHLDIRLLTLVFLDANVVVFVEISGLFPLLPRFFASVFHPFASFA